MTRAKRERRERTDNWELIQQWCRMPEQRLYESIRPITLYGIPPAERAQETGLAESTLRRTADTFEELGMAGLFRPTKQQREDHHRSLPVPMRQLIVDLKAEYPDFSLREIAEICYVQFDRRPSHNTIKQVLADGPTPLRTTRQYPLYADIPDPAERRVAVIRLHAQGWSVTSIAAYLGVARKTIYQILKRLSSKKGYAVWRTSRMPIRIGSLRWIYVPATPSANCKRTRGSGEYRMHGALLQLGIRLSPRTRCADHGRESAVVWADQTRHREERAEIPSVYGTISP